MLALKTMRKLGRPPCHTSVTLRGMSATTGCTRPRHTSVAHRAETCRTQSVQRRYEMIEIHLDNRSARTALNDLAGRVFDLTPAMHDINQALVEGIRDRIRDGQDWDGRAGLHAHLLFHSQKEARHGRSPRSRGSRIRSRLADALLGSIPAFAG